MRLHILLASLLAAGASATAQETTAPDPCGGEAFKQFDFWLGEWNVTTPDGTLAGENLITSEENGCLVLERWRSAGGGTGQSYNYFNPATEKWRQVWISQGGLTETGTMRLEGTITYVATGQQAPFTGEWTPNEDGTVTQYFEQYDAETDQWNPWFTGLYTRKISDTR